MSQPPAFERDRSTLEQIAHFFQVMNESLQTSVDSAGDAFIRFIYPAIEQTTHLVGKTVAPIADIPLIKYATAIPGISWLLAALGQVNAEKIQREIAELRVKFPLDTNVQLAQRVIGKTTFRAAQVGLLTNFIPPFALFLFALDIGAIAALQAEMIYKIATIYGFSIDDADRRGEVLAIWAVFTGGSGTLKSGFSFLEILPGAGMVIGISSDAALIYGVGFLACRYYEVKLQRQALA
ncbi:EcsC family protein [Leptolyngbya iicbica]|uniref:DUF697 domain-containing protein n=2 Tax=Cyanophyceae TaxID=3028117 RepID=A0A4Q7EEF8_9CYAN|nr:EcsC family protein [Leptolyngbya sp. LK]RZM79655.1 hypothetical protein DYY88_13195 [Leptolyngbya sp. LK]